MRRAIYIVCIILIIFGISSCKKDKPPIPHVTTTDITNISWTTASSGGYVTDDGGLPILIQGVCWSPEPQSKTIDYFTQEKLGSASFTSSLTNLKPNTLYYVRAYATNNNGTGFGNEKSFTTNQLGVPVLTTRSVSKIDSNTAESGGNITTDNGSPVTERGVCWGISQNPTVSDSKTTNGTGSGAFASSITGLKPSTVYYVRAYATNSLGTVYGNQFSFKTPYDLLFTKENNYLIGRSVIKTYDGGNVIFGSIYRDHLPPNQATDWSPYIIKLDAAGNKVWESDVIVNVTYTGSNYCDILETKDHKIVFCNRSYVVMLDETGNVLWKFDYKTDERYFCTTLIESDENNFFVLSSNELKTVLLKVSMDGKLIYEKLVKDGSDAAFTCGYLLCKLDNDNYFIAGSGRRDEYLSVWMAEINASGDITWEYFLKDSYKLNKCTDMIRTTDGGIIMTAYGIGTGSEYIARVLKVDPGNALSWEKSFSWNQEYSIPNAIIQDSNGDFVICGIQGYQLVKGVLMKLSSNGGQLWKQAFYPESEIDFVWYLNGLQQIQNGGYVAVGYKSTLWGVAMPKGVWVRRVDSDGH